jgi:hypothetical protein
MYNLCLLAGYSEEYIAENHKQINQLARDAFPELDRTQAEEVPTGMRMRTSISYITYQQNSTHKVMCVFHKHTLFVYSTNIHFYTEI